MTGVADVSNIFLYKKGSFRNAKPLLVLLINKAAE